jgi:hypothetical protein
MTALRVLDAPVDCLPVEVVAAFFFEDARPLRGAAALLDWRLNGRLTAMLLAGEISGRFGEQVLVANNGKLAADWALFIGAGRSADLASDSGRRLFTHLLEICRRAGFSRVAVGLSASELAKAVDLSREMATLLERTSGASPECLLTFDEDI